jgi:hypothetical protein
MSPHHTEGGNPMIRTLTLLAALSAGLAGSVAHAAPAAGSGKPTLTWHYLEIHTSFAATIPLNRIEHAKLGDRFWSHIELYKWNGTKPGAHVGHGDLTAVVLTPHVDEITGVAYLPGGTLTIVGEATDQRVNTVPIVGGTGIYATARGEVITRDLGGPNSNKNADTIRLWM